MQIASFLLKVQSMHLIYISIHLQDLLNQLHFIGGVTFEDYKVIGDSLVEHGGVDVTGDEEWVIRIHYKMDNSGVRQEFYRDSVYDDYENFYVRPVRR